MPLDRAATLRNAEKLLRQGKLEAAIAEYVRVVEEQPQDWNTANALGDLYVRTGQIDKAIEHFVRIADNLIDRGFLQKAGALYKKVLKLKPGDEHALLQGAEIAASLGLLADARSCLNAVIERRRDRGEPVIEVLQRAVRLSPDDSALKSELGRALLACGDIGGAFGLVEPTVDKAVALSRWAAAAAALQEFLGRAPHHIPAALRLVEIAVDGGGDATLDDAQARLADAYIAAGAASEARFVAEDLVARHPDQASVERFRRVLVLLGEPDPDALIAAYLPSEPAPGPEPGQQLQAEADPSEATPEARPDASGEGEYFDLSATTSDLASILEELESPAPMVHATSESVEVDLSIVLEERKAEPAPEAAASAAELPESLDGIFGNLRDEAARRLDSTEAEERFRRGLALREAGDVDGCLQALQAASRAPALRFAAAALAGRILRERGMTPQAIEWLERGAQAPAPTAAAAHQLLYELADCLESVGEGARALAVLLELQTETGQYRDIEPRIARLAKVQARG